MSHDDGDTWEPNRGKARPPTYPDLAKAALNAEHASLADERLALMQEKLRMAEAGKARWWAEWIKPSFILPAFMIIGSAFVSYQSDRAAILKQISDNSGVTQARFQEQAAAMTTMVNEMHASFKVIDERATKNIPIIEATRSAVEQQKLINDGNNDRVQNMAVAIGDLRRSVEALRDAVQKTREEMISSEAKRQREGRLMIGPHGPRGDTPADVQPGR